MNKFDLHLCNKSKYFVNLRVVFLRRAEKDISVEMGGVVTVVDQLGVGADHAVVEGYEFEKAQRHARDHVEGVGSGFSSDYQAAPSLALSSLTIQPTCCSLRRVSPSEPFWLIASLRTAKQRR